MKSDGTKHILVILPLMGQPQPHPYTHNTADNKSALLLIISTFRCNYTFFMLALLRWTSFWPPSMVYNSVIIIHTLQITIFHMLYLCGQLSCTASTPVFLTFGFTQCFQKMLLAGGFEVEQPFQVLRTYSASFFKF